MCIQPKDTASRLHLRRRRLVFWYKVQSLRLNLLVLTLLEFGITTVTQVDTITIERCLGGSAPILRDVIIVCCQGQRSRSDMPIFIRRVEPTLC